MQTHVDRPTAVANALAAAQTDTFEEEHPGPDILKLENTARNRVKREFKRDQMRNLWLQRLYDGTFFYRVARVRSCCSTHRSCCSTQAPSPRYDSSIQRRRVECQRYIAARCGIALRALHDMQRHIRRGMRCVQCAARSANATAATTATDRNYGPTNARRK